MDPFTSETDDESATKSRTVSSSRKSIRKRKIRLTHELNSDARINLPVKTPTFGRTKKKISNSFLPKIDNVSLVAKVIVQRTPVTVDKKKVKQLDMHKMKLQRGINKKSKSKDVSNDKENSVDYSDFFRKCSVILTRLTSKQMQDALKRHTTSCQEGETSNVKTRSPRTSLKQGRSSSIGKQKEYAFKKSHEGEALEDEVAKETTGVSRRSSKQGRSLSTGEQKEDVLIKHTASSYDGKNLENVETSKETAGSPRRISKLGRSSSSGTLQEDALKKPTSLSHEGESLEDEMAKESTGVSTRGSRQGRSLSTGKKDSLNNHTTASHDGENLENVEAAVSPRSSSRLGRSSSSGKLQEDALKKPTSLSQGGSLEDEVAIETMGVSRRGSRQGRSLSTGKQKEDVLNKSHDGGNLENMEIAKQTAGSPRRTLSTTAKKQEDTLKNYTAASHDQEKFKNLETAKETDSPRKSSKGRTSSTDLNVTFEIPEEEIKTCKSILHKSTSRSPNSNAHRVTFNITSIVMDRFSTPIPTRFPSDEENEHKSRNFGKTIFPITTPTSASKKVASPAVNALHAGATPAHLKSTDKKVLKKGTMPDFAKMHQKMYDKMQNIQDYKDQKTRRAKLLLSGCKPDSATKTSNLPKTSSAKKQIHRKLSFSRVPTNGQVLNNSKNASKNKSPTRRREQELAIKNKSHPVRSSMENIRTEIKGIRSNRRFELLMKFRRGQ